MRWPRIVYAAGLTFMALGAIGVAYPSPSFAAETSVKLKVSFDRGRLSIEAENASLDRILEIVSARVGFSVARTGSRYAPPLITGRRTGDLDRILAWLLSNQNYILLRAHLDSESEGLPGRPTQLLLMNSPRRDAAGVPGPRERLNFAAPGIDTASRAQRALPDAADPQGGLAAAVDAAADSDRGQSGTGLGGGMRSEDVGRLSASGNRLPDIVIDARDTDIVRTVDLAGDTPLSTHVMLHQAAGPSLQRTEEGTWVPWDGHIDSLIDNRFTPANGGVTFEVIKGDLSDDFFPMTFTVAYRTESGLMFGSFQVMPDQQIPL